ncbi:hypothetical protein K0651_03555 [Ornithinimicrobium sp. Arc0846-15]|nr:hypothetical protein [Ornithinimicrobium laminariae]
MNNPGETNPAVDDMLVQSRIALLDALDALADHRDAVIIIGAQAVYLHAPPHLSPLAESTKDSDLAFDPRALNESPLIEEAMSKAGFVPDPTSQQPGAWQTPVGIPVDLMVPAALAGPGGTKVRGARLPPHHKRAMRRAHGLEATIVDNVLMPVQALGANDTRSIQVKVAGPAALIVAKVHKIVERLSSPHRLNDKDAHDVYRLLKSVSTEDFVGGFTRLLQDEISQEATESALKALREHVAPGSESTISRMAGRAEEGIGEPETVALATALLASDFLKELP